MKRNAWKKMTKSALSLLLVVSIFAGLGFARPSAYAMDEGAEAVQETVVEDTPVVVEAVPVVETEPIVKDVSADEPKAETPAEDIKEDAIENEEESEEEITEEVSEDVVEEVAEKAPAAAKMSLVKAAPAAVQNEEAASDEEAGNDASDAEEAAEEEITEEVPATPAPKYTYYNNENHDIAINVYEDGKMVCNVQNTEATGEDLAIVQLHDSEGSVISNSLKDDLRNLVTNIVLGEGILGVGWSGYDYYVNPEKTDVFHGFEKLTEVTPSSTLEVIGWSAFRKCFNLVSFDFSVCKNLTTVMRQAFSNTALKSADFSETQVETIGHGAFENCTNLEEVSIPSTVTDIAEQAFYKCDGIQEIEYNAAAYETSTSDKGVKNPYLASAIFSASKNNDYSLTIGTDVEVLPRGFFKAVQGAGEISFSAMDDGDDRTVSGRSLAVDKDATYNQSPAPFKTLSTDCVVDENGVLYEKKDDALQITYFSPELTQYTLPKNVQVKEDAIEVANIGDHASSKVSGVVTYKIEASDELAGVDAADLPDFKISDTVLVLKNKDGGSSFKPFSAADLTGNAAYSVTVENEDGSKTEYNFSLSGWSMEDGTVLALDEAVSLSGDVSLTSVWNLSKKEIPAPAPEKKAEPAASEDKAPAAVQATAAARDAEELNDEAVPMAESQIGNVEEIAEDATPLAATPLTASLAGAIEEAPETAESHMNLFLIALLVLAILAVIIFLNRKDKEENA